MSCLQEITTIHPNYIKLHETDEFVLGHIFEQVYLTEKTTDRVVFIGDFYGDPSCGLISRDNTWCLVGGATLILWTEMGVTEIEDSNLRWACKLRQTDTNTVEILIDPWADTSSIWEFNTHTRERTRIKNFDDYKNKEYTDDIDW